MSDFIILFPVNENVKDVSLDIEMNTCNRLEAMAVLTVEVRSRQLHQNIQNGQLGVQIIMFSKVPLQHPTMQQGLLFVHNGRGYPHNH